MSTLFTAIERYFQEIANEPQIHFRLKGLQPNLRESFSADEVDTGIDLGNGKRLFSRRIDFGALPNTTSKNVAHGISNLNVDEGAYTLIFGTVSNDTTVEPLALAANVTVVELTATNVTITTGADLSGSVAVVYLLYTKD